jgi:putative copper export protein
MLPLGASVILVVVHAVSAAIWIGGLVAIFVVARAASATLDRAHPRRPRQRSRRVAAV